MHHDEQELLSLSEGCHRETTKTGGLTRNCAPRQDEKKVEYIRRHKRGVRTRDGEDSQGAAREAQRALEVGHEGIQDAREARVVHVDAAAGGAQSSAVGDRHG